MGWKRGTTVMEAMPFVHAVREKYREERCNFCLTKCATLKKCSACKMSWYCSRPCQKGDWKLHKVECPMMKCSPCPDMLRLVLRLVIRVMAGDMERKLEESEKPCLRSFKDLMSYNVRQNRKTSQDFETLRTLLQICTLGLLQLPSEDVLLDIYGKVLINLFSIIYDDTEDGIAIAMYNSPSLMDHDCVPNAIYSFDGRNIIVRVVTDMDSESYQDLRISYVGALDTTAERQAKLQENYYFTCTCRNCTSPELDRLMLAIEGGTQGDVDRVKGCLDKVKHMLERQEDPSSILSTCERCLSTVSHLPITNVYVIRLTSRTFNAALSTENYEKAVRLGLKNLKAYNILLPHYNLRAGDLYFLVAQALFFLDKFPECLENINKALEIRSVIYGEQHPLYQSLTKFKGQCETLAALSGMDKK